MAGDPGYIAGETHGLIAAPSIQGTAQWGCDGTYVSGTSTTLGSGAANTAAIVSACSTTTIAARLCANLVLNGYSDWYLPSIDELYKLYINRSYIGAPLSGNYWSSSQATAYTAFECSFGTGVIYNNTSKIGTYYVRAVRAF